MALTKKIIISTFYLILLSTCVVEARWSTLEDASTKNTYHYKCKVNPDGSYEIISKITNTILTEAGRAEKANRTLRYNGDNETLQILEAKTIYQGKEYPVDKNLIEDKPLASANEGFDQKRQVLIAFPNAVVGAKILLKYKLTVKKSLLDNFFAENFYFGLGGLVENYHLEILSAIPLNTLVNDPENFIKIKETHKDGQYQLEATLKQPIFKKIINEPSPILINYEKFNWLSVSSHQTWNDLALDYSKLILPILAQKLPPSFNHIIKKAQAKKTTIEKINTVTSLLNDQIRYTGDWRSVNGRYIPRDLDKIAKTQLGDCKDFSAATAVILNQLGLKAQLALVIRGIGESVPESLPGFDNFNHMMLKVTDDSKQIYWIDPTNFESMAGGIFPDIADKMALVIDQTNPAYEKITASTYPRAKTHSQRTLLITEKDEIIEVGKLLLQHSAALGITGAKLQVSEETIKNAIFYDLTGYSLTKANDFKLKSPPLDSRIVSDLLFEYQLIREGDLLKTNLGPALKPPYNETIDLISNLSPDYVSNQLISDTLKIDSRKTIINNVKVKNVESLNIEVKSPWLEVSRHCHFENQNLHIDDLLTIHQNVISSSDLKTAEFLKLKKQLKEHFNELVIVLEPIRP